MRVLLIHDYGAATGGAERQVLALRRGLRERGHEVRLLASRAQLVLNEENEADVTCYGTRGRLQVFTQTANISAVRTLRRTLAEFRPDIVHVRMFLWQISPVIMPLLRKIPAIYQTAVYKSVCPIGTKLLPSGQQCGFPAGRVCLQQGCIRPVTFASTMLQLRLFQRWRHVFNAVVALSTPMRRLLESNGLGPVRVINNGVQARAPRPPLGGDPVVAYAGRLAPEKGVTHLIRAFALVQEQVPTAKLIVVGDGPERTSLERLVGELRLTGSVEFTGFLPFSTLDRRLEEAWVQVIPSLWEEPFGNVTTEAMMRGTAVIATATGGAVDAVRDGLSGRLVQPGDIGALTATLKQLVANRELAERLGRSAHEIAVTNFSEDVVLDRFEALYQELSAVGNPARMAAA